MLKKAIFKISSPLLWGLIFVGCTQQRMAFRFADTAASWKADDYFDLSGSQKDEVKKHLKIFLKKSYDHNDREIPKLFERADQILAKVDSQNKLDCGEVEKIRVQAGTLMTGLATVAAPYVKSLTETLSEKQIRYFVGQVDEKIADDQKKLKNSLKQEELRRSRALDNLQIFLGSLSKEQQTEIEAHVKAHPFPFADQFDNKKQNAEKLRAASHSPQAFQKFILDYLQNWRRFQSVTYLDRLDKLRAQNERFYQGLICQADVKQLKHFKRKLSEVKGDFENILIQN